MGTLTIDPFTIGPLGSSLGSIGAPTLDLEPTNAVKPGRSQCRRKLTAGALSGTLVDRRRLLLRDLALWLFHVLLCLLSLGLSDYV